MQIDSRHFLFHWRKFAKIRGPRSRAGFTLLEVMTVVIILGIIAGAVLPNMRGGMDTVRVDAAARRLADLLDFCYRSAVATGRVHGLVLDQDGRHYQVMMEQPSDPAATQPEDPEAPPTLVPVHAAGMTDRELPEGVAITQADFFEEDRATAAEGQVRVLFFPDGTTEFMTLELTSEAGDTRKLELNGLSGTVTIIDPRTEQGDEEDDEAEAGGQGEE